jgi:hypothetical protein
MLLKLYIYIKIVISTRKTQTKPSSTCLKGRSNEEENKP